MNDRMRERKRFLLTAKENRRGKKIIYINETCRRLDGAVREGGFSRNLAWENWMRKHVADFQEIRLRKGKILHHFQVFLNLLMRRNTTVFFLYPFLGVPVFYLNGADRLLSACFFFCLKICLKHNRVVFDISDLKHEQAIDLELVVKEHPRPYGEIEKKLFSTEALFIFASHRMRDYACEKYGIPAERTDVCVNGGNAVNRETAVPLKPEQDRINYVYAGTLNKGRQIEELLEAFPEDENLHLYLMGTGGEWIHPEKKNITCLGSLEEETAHRFVSLCDVGLIPYDETRLYYHLAYPTKLSFYLTAGIPFLSTPVEEIRRAVEGMDSGWLAPVSEWEKRIRSLSREEIGGKRENVLRRQSAFFWETILDRNRWIH